MKVACLWSGGKDSTYACYLASKMGFKVKRIVTFYSQNSESMLFHVPNIRWTTLQAKSMELPQDLVSTPQDNEREAMEQTFLQLKESHGIDGIVSGVMASNYQRKILQEICDKVGLKLITPLWGLDPLNILQRILNENFKVLIVGVYAEGLTSQWLGKEIDEVFVEHLKKLFKMWGVHPCGEGGEYETFVIDAPCFKKKIKVLDYKITWHRNWGEMIILNAELADKEVNT